MPEIGLSLKEMRIQDYKIVILNPHSKLGYDVSSICSSISWDYDLDSAVETLTATLIRVGDLSHYVQEGNMIYFFGWRVSAAGLEWGEVKRGQIKDSDVTYTNGGEMKITAYDIMDYLASNKDSHILSNETASAFIKRVCQLHRVSVGVIYDTKIILPRYPFFEQSLYDMFVTVLSITRDIANQRFLQQAATHYSGPQDEDNIISANAENNGDPSDDVKRFFLVSNGGQLNLIVKRDPGYIWLLESGLPQWKRGEVRGNILSARSTRSMRNYRNVVKVYARKDLNATSDDVVDASDAADSGDPTPIYQIPAPDKIDTDVDILQFGMYVESVSLTGTFQDQVVGGEFTPDQDALAKYQAEEVYKRLKRIDQTGTVTSLNINTLRAGDAIYIDEPITGMKGKFYIKSGNHLVSTSESSMTLTINYEDRLPEAYKSQVDKSSDLIGAVFGG